MKIVVFTIGTHGDARPFAAFGRALGLLGHEVTIATAERHEALVTGAGLAFAPITSDFADLMVREQAAMSAGNQLRLGVRMARAVAEWMPTWRRQGAEAAEGAGLVVGSGAGTAMAYSFAEKLEVPFVQAQFMPLTPSREIPPLWPSPRRLLPGAANLALHHIVRATMWRLQAHSAAILRRELGLPPFPCLGPWALPRSREPRRILYAFSRHLQPQPTDWPSGTVAVTGSWFHDEGQHWTPSDELSRFLAAGPKPVYVGFGSMLPGASAALTGLVLDAVARSNERAIVATGWGGLDPGILRRAPCDRILPIDGVPHDWLFPRTKLVIHHGGSGTVAAAARAGVPQVILPFVADQFFWSWRLNVIGLNPVLLNRRTMSAADLLGAVRLALDRPALDAALRISALMAKEDGVRQAIEVLRRWSLLSAEPDHLGPPTPADSGTRAEAGTLPSSGHLDARVSATHRLRMSSIQRSGPGEPSSSWAATAAAHDVDGIPLR